MGSAVLLGQLYHWSPADRFHSIRAHGLVPGSPQVTCTRAHPHICLSPDPLTAWELSAQVVIDTGGAYARVAWDLWQVTLDKRDEVRIPAMYGPHIAEVQVDNVIPPVRAVYLARRARPRRL